MSDYKGAALLLHALPPAKAILGDRGYDADWFRNALAARGITACIGSKINRKLTIPHDTMLYRQRHKIENMFDRKGLAAHPHPLRPLRPHVHVRYRNPRNRHLLARSMRWGGCRPP